MNETIAKAEVKAYVIETPKLWEVVAANPVEAMYIVTLLVDVVVVVVVAVVADDELEAPGAESILLVATVVVLVIGVIAM